MDNNGYFTVQSEITFYCESGAGLRPKYRNLTNLINDFSRDMKCAKYSLETEFKEETKGLRLINKFHLALEKLIIESNNGIVHIAEGQLEQYIKIQLIKMEELLRSLNNAMYDAEYYGGDFCESFWGTLLLPSIEWTEHLQELNHTKFIPFNEYFKTYKGVS
jgi:hypothetical protein